MDDEKPVIEQEIDVVVPEAPARAPRPAVARKVGPKKKATKGARKATKKAPKKTKKTKAGKKKKKAGTKR